MAANKWKTKDQKEDYLARLSDLHLKRWMQLRMSQELGVSTRQIRRDLDIIRQRWRDTQIGSIAERRRQETQTLALVEKEAWDAWDKSKEDAETRTQKVRKAEAGGQGSPVELSIRTEGQAGDATYLKTVLDVNRERRKLLGTDAPERHVFDFSNLTDEELDAELARLEAEEGTPPGDPDHTPGEGQADGPAPPPPGDPA